MIKNIAESSIAIGKEAGKGILKHILFIGFSLILFIIAIIMVGVTEGGAGVPASGHTGGAGAAIGLLSLFVIDFWPMLLCITSLLLFPFLYFSIINKSIVHASLFKLWKKNLEGWFITKIKEYSAKYFSGENKASIINDKATLKIKLIQDIQNDKTNSRWQRKIFSFILKKVKLDDFDATQPDAKLSDFIVEKAINFVSDLGEPSSKPLFIVFGSQIVVLILAIVFNN
ncbi:hypothetical protein H0I23_00430 [Cellulophaga sp. HaHaR_3_176]|uniref:hypothetical protein n=1 Tax=Cellulophaga sp. HaHaR_3_176 TaxID=1942464 RepID=UPI001C1F9CCC|nr:hypothetical protein [Cellulophaga sp. HaHaR_3_176]QWX84149.1 hypothetical protein H0I23_00430 [Cellulophaga sp. HaHaR_3_176]